MVEGGEYMQYRRKSTEKCHRINSDKIFDIFVRVFMLLVFIIVAYPIIYVISASLSAPTAIMSGKVKFLPVEFNLEGYRVLFNYSKVLTGFYNSAIYSIFGTAISMFLTVCGAYALSRPEFKVKRVVLLIFACTMWFSGGIIPTYLVVQKLGLIDTRWAMLIPAAVSFYNMTIVRTYFINSIPKDLFEAASIDGCDYFKFLFKILLPLSVPVLAVVGMYYAVGQWNSFFNAYLYLQDKRLFPIQIVLRDILILNSSGDAMGDLELSTQREYMAELLKYSLIVVASLPVIVIYLCVQKHLVKGIMIGAIKG